jgi:hypothetical protein
MQARRRLRNGTNLRRMNVGAAAAVALLVALPVVATASVYQRLARLPDELDPPASPVVAQATRVMSDRQRSIAVEVSFEPAVVIRAPDHEGGIVQAVLVKSGDPLNDGDPMLRVDGVTLYVLRSPEPITRTLSLRSVGADVIELETSLAASGWFEGVPDDRFDEATESALEHLQAVSGYARPDGVFRPADAVWVPIDATQAVSTVAVAAGQRFPAAGEPIARLRQAPTTVTTDPPFETDEVMDVSSLAGGPIVPQPDGSLPDSAVREIVGAIQAGRIEPDRPPTTTSDGDVVEFAFTASARLAEPIETIVVPIGSVISDPSGTACLFVVSSTGAWTPLRTTVTDSDLNSVTIVPGPPDDTGLLTNPLDVLKDPRC